MRKRLKTKGDLGAQGLQEAKSCGYTLDCGEKEGRKMDTVSRTWIKYYRIRYYLSSEKLKTVN